MSKPFSLTPPPEAMSKQPNISRRKRHRLHRLLGEVMDSISDGERRVGDPDARVRRSKAVLALF